MDLIDVSPYVSPTRFHALGGVFLARAVLQAAPSRESDRVSPPISRGRPVPRCAAG